MSKKKYGVYRVVAIVNEIQSWINDLTWDQNGYKIVEGIVVIDRQYKNKNSMLKAIINKKWGGGTRIDEYKILEEILPGQYKTAKEFYNAVYNCMSWRVLISENGPYDGGLTYDPDETWDIVDQVSEYLGFF